MSEQAFDFRSWIREQPPRGYEASWTDTDNFVMQTDYATARISFYDMSPDPEVVELHIEEKATGDTKFFLHFQPQERNHSMQLFREMTQALVALRDTGTTEVLLCCTVGMTTSFFAEKLNQVAEALALDWRFSAVASSEAVEHGHNKAAVLIAPQIGYQLERMQAMLPQVPVLAIPTSTFASYDAAGCVEWLREELRHRKQTVEQRALEHVARDLVNDKRIFVVATHADAKQATINYRVYDCGKIVLDEQVIKCTLSLSDITDVLDTQACSCKTGFSMDAIGIALPGIISHGKFNVGLSRTLQLGDKPDFDVQEFLKRRYDAPVFLCNNANAAALGWYGSQDGYQSVSFHSQALGWPVGGQGHVVDGHLVEGAHGIAGEIRFFENRLSVSNPLHFSAYSPQDVLELLGQVLAIDCVTFDPEVIALRCDLLPNMDEVADEVAKYIPQEYLPAFVHVDNYNECILLGVMIRCLQELVC